MTSAELEQLSRDVAEKYGIKPNSGMEFCNEKSEPLGIYKDGRWLHDNIEKCATLAIEHSVDLNFYDAFVNSSTFTDDGYNENNETYADHNGNKIRVTCVAIMKALLAKDKP